MTDAILLKVRGLTKRFAGTLALDRLDLDKGWHAIDEMNRALDSAPPGGFQQPPHIITKANVDTDINADGIYEPKVDDRTEYAKIWGH